MAGGQPAVQPSDLARRLLRLNNEDRSWLVRVEADQLLVAEWKVAEPSWFGAFQRAGIVSVDRVLLVLWANRLVVSARRRRYRIRWAGVPWSPNSQLELSRWPGWRIDLSALGPLKSSAAGGREGGYPVDGDDHKYRFDLSEITTPIRDAVEEAGWKFDAGRLLRRI